MSIPECMNNHNYNNKNMKTFFLNYLPYSNYKRLHFQFRHNLNLRFLNLYII